MNRIAPNNSLPATHFIEVYDFKVYDYCEYTKNPLEIFDIEDSLFLTEVLGGKTVAIFKIRKNKLPTLHNFKTQ